MIDFPIAIKLATNLNKAFDVNESVSAVWHTKCSNLQQARIVHRTGRDIHMSFLFVSSQ